MLNVHHHGCLALSTKPKTIKRFQENDLLSWQAYIGNPINAGKTWSFRIKNTHKKAQYFSDESVDAYLFSYEECSKLDHLITDMRFYTLPFNLWYTHKHNNELETIKNFTHPACSPFWKNSKEAHVCSWTSSSSYLEYLSFLLTFTLVSMFHPPPLPKLLHGHYWKRPFITLTAIFGYDFFLLWKWNCLA